MSSGTALIAQQTWLEPVAETVGKAVAAAFSIGGASGRRVKDALNGVTFGHPLHPALTDIPIGAWSMAFVFDLMDAWSPNAASRTAASVCINAGLIGAAGAAITGLADWSDTGGGSRRLGFVHGALNIVATSLYAASAIARRRRPNEPAGRGAAYLAYLVASFSAYLGGDLVYARRIGVDHATSDAELPDGFTPALAESELPDGAVRKVMIGEVPVLLVRRGGVVYALAEHCAHQGGPLSEGTFDECSVTCPWHGSRFALDDGAVLNGPSAFPQPRFEVRISAERIEIRQS
jgi:nitrite reductase/ring-hydroxylating ferredoxin subunit/uncharacterized membrane protein